MNLTSQDKKWFSRIAIILAGILIVAASYKGVISAINTYKEGKEVERKELIHKYESKIDSIKAVNYMLAMQADSLQKQITVEQGKKEIVYIETTQKEKEIKDATASQHALAIDSLTGQDKTWAVVKDTISQDTIIHYKFTKPGVLKLRLTVNDLYKYKKLYNIDEAVIFKQNSQLNLYKTMIDLDQEALSYGTAALKNSEATNDKFTKQVNKLQKFLKTAKQPFFVCSFYQPRQSRRRH